MSAGDKRLPCFVEVRSDPPPLSLRFLDRFSPPSFLENTACRECQAATIKYLGSKIAASFTPPGLKEFQDAYQQGKEVCA